MCYDHAGKLLSMEPVDPKGVMQQWWPLEPTKENMTRVAVEHARSRMKCVDWDVVTGPVLLDVVEKLRSFCRPA